VARFELRIEPLPPALPPARHRFAAWLKAKGVRDEVVDDALIVMSELVTNGILHDGGGDITFTAFPLGGGVWMEVVTAPGQGGRRQAWLRRSPEESGRGLLIADAMTDRMSVGEEDGRRLVTCHVPASGSVPVHRSSIV
jgi:anti-sigma regulatory factor (Ser/Thr protein kinase)